MTRPIDDLFGELSRPLGPTDWPEPAQLRRKAEHKRTVRRVTVASSIAVVAAFAFAVPATLANRHAASSGPASSISFGAPTIPSAVATSHEPSPAATVKAKSPALPGVTILKGDRHTFGPVSLEVPNGWTVKLNDVGMGARVELAHSACIAPPVTAATKTVEGCAGLQVWYDGYLPGAGDQSYVNHARETAMAWHHSTDPATCPAAPGRTGAAVKGYRGLTMDYQKAGGKLIDHNAWVVQCDDGTTFEPQGWVLPVTTKVAFFDYVGDKQAQAILATAQFSAG